MNSIDKKEKFVVVEESEIYSIYAISNKNRENETVYIDMDDCINILSRLYDFLYEEFIIFKIEYTSPDFKIPIIEYNIFTQYGTRKIPLNSCRNSKIKYYINRNISDYEDYKYNPENNYYYNICSINERTNDTVLTLYQRRKIFNMNNMSLCESKCIFKRYVNNTIYCDCEVKMKFNSFMNVNVSKYDLIHRFDMNFGLNINIWVTQCFLIFLSKDFILSNLFSQIILGIIFFSLISIFIFYLKEKYILFNNIKKLIIFMHLKREKESIQKKHIFKNKIKNTKVIRNNSLININNRSTTKRLNYDSNLRDLKPIIKIKATNHIIEQTYNELNNLSYSDALSEDNRTFFQYYFSLIMTKNILIFTFSCKYDFNSKVIKLCFFLYIFIIHLVTNTIFITDDTFQLLFITQGKVIFHYYKNIIVICIITLVIKNILLNIIFTESNILSTKKSKIFKTDKILSELSNIIEIKSSLFFLFNLLSLSLFWVYMACFFTIFEKAKIFILINTSISLGFSLLLPICLGFVPGIIRFYSLSNRKAQNRLFSYYLSQIIQSLL